MIVTFLSLLLMTAGVGFLVIAALGVLRLPDAFQRMHSSTKAGSLGTTLIVTGALLAATDINLLTAILTILFTLLTLPVASQLLGRAAYVSGATIARLERADPLEEVLEREDQPLEERIRQK